MMKGRFKKFKNILSVILLSIGVQFLFLSKVLATENTIIQLADPTIFYHNGIYYLYGTTNSGGQGFAVYTSTDQKNWNGPAGVRDGYALKKEDAYGESGFWAPQVFYYNNKFYMAYTAEENIAIAVSDSPLGPFTQQVKKSLFTSGRNIDPFVFIDDNDKKYLYYVVMGGGQERIFVAELEDDFSAIRSQTAKECLSASSGTWERNGSNIVEGPTVIKQEGKYFLIYSANAYENPNYAVGYATSTNPTGSWSKYSGNPILKKEDIGINGPGHGDLYKDASGNWKYVFHTHNSNSVVNPRKVAVANVSFINSGQQLEFDVSDFYYAKRTIYFKQDFNATANYFDYVGLGGNQFDGIEFNGNSSVNITGNKLRIVKNGGTGVNRAGITKTDHPFNPGGEGGFLKFAMTVTVSNNTTNVPEGFRFSVGALMWGTAPASPDVTKVHSDLYINPKDTPGTFTLHGGNGSSAVSSPLLAGTQKLVWYINNSGSRAGYDAPDGTIGNVPNDAADVWAISGTTAILVLNDVPATTPEVEGLRTFKISNDPNFVATLDIDDIEISEEPVVQIDSVTYDGFFQDFNTEGVPADYVSTAADATTNNKFAGITAVTAANITNNKLRFERANVSSYLSSWTIGGATSPLSPVPAVAKISMEYTISNNAGYPNQRAFLAIGESFSTNQHPPVNGNVHSSFSIRCTGNAGEFYVNNGTVDSQTKGAEAGPYSGTVVFTWIVNNSGATYTYTAPDGSSAKVANDTWDLYIGNALILNDQEAITATKNLTAVKYAFGNTNAGSTVNGKIAVDMDDISFQTLSATLPVSLASFTGAEQGKHIRLNWNTVSEQNNSHFEVYRSADGINFQSIGTVAGNGTSKEPHIYTYIDSSPLAGANYYRLAQVDFDGGITLYPGIISVQSSLKLSNEFRIVCSGDNQLKLYFFSGNTTVGYFTISDLQGRKLYENRVRIEKGNNIIEVLDAELTEGIFIGTLLMNEELHCVKFVK